MHRARQGAVERGGKRPPNQRRGSQQIRNQATALELITNITSSPILARDRESSGALKPQRPSAQQRAKRAELLLITPGPLPADRPGPPPTQRAHLARHVLPCSARGRLYTSQTLAAVSACSFWKRVSTMWATAFSWLTIMEWPKSSQGQLMIHKNVQTLSFGPSREFTSTKTIHHG